MEKTAGSTTVKYTWSGDQLIEVRNSSGALLRKFIYGTGIDEPILINNGSSNYYYTHDGLGSILEITGSTGAIAEKYTYDVYGKPSLFDSTGTPISSSTVDNPYYFTGREFDFETGLYYYRVRYYDPVLGRFLETDPLEYVDSLNLYSYVGNNPVNWTDPFGLMGEIAKFAAKQAAKRLGGAGGKSVGTRELSGTEGDLFNQYEPYDPEKNPNAPKDNSHLADTDGDGVPDYRDNDDDGDGIADGQDETPQGEDKKDTKKKF